jgi:hypothetical protein
MKAIIAELRRSAMEDAHPWIQLRIPAFKEACLFAYRGESLGLLANTRLRIFYLLVAAALERP